MEKEKKRNLPVVKYIIIIIVLANVLISVVPTLIDSAGDLFGESETESYSDLRIINVSSQVVPDFQGRTAGDGYQMYRFDLTVDNQGSQPEKVEYSSFYLNSSDGEVYMQYENTDSASAADKEDTRILPVGRYATVTLYAEISNGTTSIEISNYNTPDSEEETFMYMLAEGTV